MERDPRKYLWDAREAACAIIAFTRAKSFDDYTTDVVLRSATERQFQIVGEALLRLSKIDPLAAERIPDFRKIVGFRHVIVHGYDAIDSRLVWRTVQEDLPKLIATLSGLLPDQ